MTKIDLVQFIRENPGCTFTVDNDCWWVSDPSDPENILVDNDTVTYQEYKGYGSGNCYGGDILQALAEIVGVKIESV